PSSTNDHPNCSPPGPPRPAVVKGGKKMFDEVAYVFKAGVSDAVYRILEYVTNSGETGEFHLTPFHVLPVSSTRDSEPTIIQAKEVLRHTYIHHATHGPVLVTATSERLIKDAGAYTAITRTHGALLVVDGIIASPWAIRHELYEWTFGIIVRGLYTILKPMNLHTAILGSDSIAVAAESIAPTVFQFAGNLNNAIRSFVMPGVKA
ncbi:hypothetical protein HK097_010031, partial [Rhizophlyctis rosea]